MSEYIGGRIVPTHGGVWDKGKSYEELTIVLNEATGDSFISKRPVPVGTEIYEEHYWVLYSQYNEQITRAEDHLDDTARAIRSEMDEQAKEVHQRMDQAEENVDKRAGAAEKVSNDNKTALEKRMASIEARQEANVKASTTPDADYAAELVDARVSADGQNYSSLHSHLAAIEDGTEIQSLLGNRVKGIDLSMKAYSKLLSSQFQNHFDNKYDEETDTFTLRCIEDVSGDVILYGAVIPAVDFAEYYRTEPSLYIRYELAEIVKKANSFKFGVWLSKMRNTTECTTAGLLKAIKYGSVPNEPGVFEEVVSINSNVDLEYDEERHCYTSNGVPISLTILFAANSPLAGEMMVLKGMGNILPMIGKNAAVHSLYQNMLYGSYLSLQKDVSDIKETVGKTLGQTKEEQETILRSLRETDFRDYEVIQMETPASFAFSDSIGTKEIDEYGDESWTIEYVNNSPMYCVNLDGKISDDCNELIVEVTARLLSEKGNLRVQAFNARTGADYTAGGLYHEIGSSYRRLQFRLHRTGSTNTYVGIGPDRVAGHKVQFKDVRVLVPHEGSKQIPVPLKEYHGYLDDVSFEELEAVKVDDSIMIGTDDYARQDNLYIDSVDVYFAESNWTRYFRVGCIDQYGLFQQYSRFGLTGAKGYSHVKTDHLRIKVPAGYGIFMETDGNMPLFAGGKAYGFKNLVSRSSVAIDENGYTGNPLLETEYLVPFRYTLTEKALGVRLDEMEENIGAKSTEIQNLSSRIDILETGGENSKKDYIPLFDPSGVKYHLAVDDSGLLHPIRSIPRKVLVIGNSLVFGFGSFGMAASDIDHDYFHYLKVFLEEKNADVVFDKAYASTWESCTNSEARQKWFDDLTLTGDEDLITIQLGDNVNTDEKRATFPRDVVTLLSNFRRACPNARIVFLACWYGHGNYTHIENACTDLHIDLVDIRDLSTAKENQNELGGKYIRDGQEMEITSTGVASHPGDKGMKLIADRLIALLERYM